ncbi:HEPN domain-containing protein [Synergistaceae bacterium OttesenSCG-928-I11]|nr:HEPN domain-containing protein [Synergistaceae bacterium OttesenSCG-928-I11]
MPLNRDERLFLTSSYLEKSDEALLDAAFLLERRPGLSARCSYEAAYYLTIALFVSHGLEVPRTHEGVNHRLYEFFVRDVKNITAELAKTLGRLETHRNIAQYSPTKKITTEIAAEDLQKARAYHGEVKKIVLERLETI